MRIEIMVESHSKVVDNNLKLALLGFTLAAIAPTISVVTGFVYQAGVLAIIVFFTTKIWMFGFPAFWHLIVEKRPVSYSPVNLGGWKISAFLGCLMCVVIYAAYFLLGEKLLSSSDLKSILEPVGLTNKKIFFVAIIYWIFVNSVLEEYLFRWFLTTKLEQLIGGYWLPIIISALIFTIHHTIALSYFISPLGNFLCSLGLFIGGIIFSWLYMTTRSIWIPWLAHAMCDLAVFSIAWHLVIGF